MPTAKLTAVPPHADRSVFALTLEEERVLLDFIMGVRQTLRRGLHDGHSPADVLSAYSVALAAWPPLRRDAVLAAVEACIAPVPRPAMIPARLTDAIGRDLDGDAA